MFVDSWKCDANSNVLQINNQKIHITRKGVHGIFGLPTEYVVMKVPLRSHHCDPVIKSWRSQFPVKDEKDS